MMDANLDLQIDAARKAARRAKGGKAASRREQLLSSIGIREAPAEESPVSEDVFGRGDVFELAPQILTLCSGALQPFDFGLSAEQHTELFLAGQARERRGRTSRHIRITSRHVHIPSYATQDAYARGAVPCLCPAACARCTPHAHALTRISVPEHHLTQHTWTWTWTWDMDMHGITVPW
jgi:hypothetical protein